MRVRDFMRKAPDNGIEFAGLRHFYKHIYDACKVIPDTIQCVKYDEQSTHIVLQLKFPGKYAAYFVEVDLTDKACTDNAPAGE